VRKLAVAQNDGPDLLIFTSALALLTIGLVMVFSASSPMAFHEFGDSLYYFKRQLFWALLGTVAMIVTMNIDYHLYQRFSIAIYIAAVVLLGLVLVPGVGTVAGGSRRWIVFYGPARIQPSEVAKIAMVVMLSAYLSKVGQRARTFLFGVVVPIVACLIPVGLIILEPDLGTAVALLAVCLVVLFMGAVRIDHLLLLIPPGVAGLVWLIVTEEYRFKRYMAFIDPWSDPLDTGWHVIQSLLALGSGGLFGLGLGMSRQKYHYLPETHTDFIFSVLGEELGFLGCTLVIALFFVFAWRGMSAALKAPDRFGRLLSAGLTCMIVFQALMNIGVVTSSIPITGISLPLISSGGSSLTVTMASIGIILNVSRQSVA
jgi:cell division protein FtsW